MSRASRDNGRRGAELVQSYAETGLKRDLVLLPGQPTRQARQELAAKERRQLADEARAEDLALDMEGSVEASDSTERALAHQMAAAHGLALRLIGRANLYVESFGNKDWDRQRQMAIEMCRMSNAAARLMTTYQEAMLVLARVRTAGKQLHVVQHVQVADGGQAVIAGQVGDRGRDSSEKS